jgi:hypothetical protein
MIDANDVWLDAARRHSGTLAEARMRRMLGCEGLSAFASYPVAPLRWEDRTWLAAALPCPLDAFGDTPEREAEAVVLIAPDGREARLLDDPSPAVVTPWGWPVRCCEAPKRAVVWSDALGWARAWVKARAAWLAAQPALLAAVPGSGFRVPATGMCHLGLVIGRPRDWSPLLGPAEIIVADAADLPRVTAGIDIALRRPRVLARPQIERKAA